MTKELPSLSGVLESLLREPELADPLNVPTRKQRKLLLGVSLASIGVTWADLVPSEIAALGIKVSPSDQNSILLLLASVVLLGLVTFVIYARSDFVQWRLRLELFRAELTSLILHKTVTEKDTEPRGSDQPEITEAELLALNAVEHIRFFGQVLLGESRVRLALEVVAPCCIGSVALGMLLVESRILSFVIAVAIAAATVATALIWLALPSIQVRFRRWRLERAFKGAAESKLREHLVRDFLNGIARDLKSASEIKGDDKLRKIIVDRSIAKMHQAYHVLKVHTN